MPLNKPDRSPGIVPLIPLLALFLSGFTALCYEIAWIRQSVLVFGGTTLALGTVLAVFFGGLAIGNQVFGRMAGRVGNPVALFGRLEIGIGILAALSPWLFDLVLALLGMFGRAVGGHSPLSTGLSALFVSIVLLPPTLLMGGSLPLLAQHFVRKEGHIARPVGGLYGLNTLGALAGCLAAGFLLIPTIGMDRTIWLSALINVLAGALVLATASRREAGEREESARRFVAAGSERGRPRLGVGGGRGRLNLVYGLFFLSGFIALANEIYWTRYLALLIRNTVHTYTLTLAVVLGGIALGSLIASTCLDSYKRRSFLFGLIMITSGLLVIGVLFFLPRVWSGELHETSYAVRLALFSLVMLLPAALSGAAFPLAVRLSLDHPDLAGSRVGTMAAVNTVGGILGSMLVAFWLLPAFGLSFGIGLTSGLAILTGIIAWIALGESAERPRLAAWSVAAVIVAIVVPRVAGTRIPEDYLGRNGELVDFAEGYESNLAVVRTPAGLQLEINRLWQGSDRKTAQILAAHIPMLLHPEPKRVAGIGIGTGQTFSRFLYYDELERLYVVEIEGKLIDVLRKHYDSRWLDDPRTTILIEDGRRFVRGGEERWDILSLELGQTFRPGVSTFYTAEFYRDARELLEPDGLICQFLPIRLIGLDDFRSMIATFLEVFPASTLWYNRNEMILIGIRADRFEISGERLAERLRIPAVASDLHYSYWGGPGRSLHLPENMLGSFLMGPEGLSGVAAGAVVYRDDLPRLEYAASAWKGSDEQRIAELLARQVEPLSGILSDRPGHAPLEIAAHVQGLNLKNIAASILLDDSGRAVNRGHLVLARRFLEEARRLNRENRRVANNLGLVCAQLGDTEAAIRHLTDACQLDPGFMEARFNLGSALEGAGRKSEALLAFEKAIALRPEWPELRSRIERLRQELTDSP